MISHGYTLEGFVLKRRNFGEADRILDIYTKEKGKISLLAKGIRRPSSRKRGHLEIFSKIKFHVVSGSHMGIMTEVETIDDFKEVRKSMKKISLAYYFVEVLSKAVHDGDENIEVYNLFSYVMEKLKSVKRLKELRIEFITNLLKILGYWPKNVDLTMPDVKLDEVLERQIYSKRVGKLILE